MLKQTKIQAGATIEHVAMKNQRREPEAMHFSNPDTFA